MNEADGTLRTGLVPAPHPRWLAPRDGFFEPLLALPELALVGESCAGERRLHERLAAAPTRAVAPAELDAIADVDARENFAVFLAFRDAVVAAGSLEAYYLRLVRGGPIAVPPAFIDTVVAAIAQYVVGDRASAFERRAAQLLHRPQRIAIRDGRILCADRETADRAHAPEDFDLVRRLARNEVSDASDASDASIDRNTSNGNEAAKLRVLGTANAHEFDTAADPFAFAFDLSHEIANDLGHGLSFMMTRSDSGLAALARVLERWIAHFLDVETTIRPLQRIDDAAWRWHVGLDAESTALLNDLYRGEAPEPDRLQRMIGLFRLDFADAREMRADVAGKPVYLGLAVSAEQTLRVKPQNLLVNLPIADRA